MMMCGFFLFFVGSVRFVPLLFPGAGMYGATASTSSREKGVRLLGFEDIVRVLPDPRRRDRMIPHYCGTVINQGKDLVPIATRAILPNWLQWKKQKTGSGGGVVWCGVERVCLRAFWRGRILMLNAVWEASG